jgi:hypothetical protein
VSNTFSLIFFHAWGIASLPQIENLEDCNFKLEFNNKEEKKRVLDRGPWRHKGDALIIVHYYGLARPSEVRIESIGLWVRLYDLPPVMMKEAIARHLGGQVGNFIKLDVRYPGYMHVRVDFPLSKALVLQLKVKIEGKGIMAIDVRYKNVPHFCFTCGQLGHAAQICEEGEPDNQGINFGEELRASPPKHVREITIRQAASRVVKSLF